MIDQLPRRCQGMNVRCHLGIEGQPFRDFQPSSVITMRAAERQDADFMWFFVIHKYLARRVSHNQSRLVSPEPTQFRTVLERPSSFLAARSNVDR